MCRGIIPFVSPQDEYIVDLMENSPGGTEVVKMEATDDDKGDYGVVNYKLNDNEERFDIDTTSVSQYLS